MNRLLRPVGGRPGEGRKRLAPGHHAAVASHIAMIAQHAAVLEAIAAADPDAAERAMERHLGDVLPGLDQMQQSYPDYFASDEPQTFERLLPTTR